MRNIIFDMGNVLIHFDPERFVRRETPSPEDQALLLSEVFHAPEWPMMDSGELDEPDAEAIMLKNIPERLHPAAHRLIFSWEEPMYPVDGMAELIADCKARGFGIYLLSNASRRQPEYWPKIPGSEHFDGAVISAIEDCAKPGPEIFHVLLDRYHLDPAECLFVDDMWQNIDGAKAVGIEGYLFDGDAEALRNYIFSRQS